MHGRQIIRGVGWSSLATAINMIAQFGFLALLARLLEPGTFGVMAMATIAVRFATYFAQAGAAQTLVQQPDLQRPWMQAAFWLSLAVSLGLYLALALLAPWIAHFMATPELTQVLWWYGLMLPLSALGALPMALLRRGGRFAQASAIEVLSYLLGYGVTGSALALSGAGVWSLVCAGLAQQLLALILAFATVRYPLGGPVCLSTLRQVFAQGSRYSLIGFLEFVWGSADGVIIGRQFGQVALGLANRAQMLCNLPVEQAVGAATKVLFPALSAMQREPARVADGFLLLLLACGATSAALSAGLCAAAGDLVRLLLGPAWTDATPLVKVLAMSVPPIFLYVACGITLDSIGAIGPKLRLQAGLLVVKLLLLWWGSRHGLIGMAVAIVVSEWLRAVCGLHLVMRLLKVDAGQVAQALGMVLSVGLAVYLGVGLAGLAGDQSGLPLWARVSFEAALGLVTLGILGVASLSQWTRFRPLRRFDAVSQHVDRLVLLLRRRSARSHHG